MSRKTQYGWMCVTILVATGVVTAPLWTSAQGDPLGDMTTDAAMTGPTPPTSAAIEPTADAAHTATAPAENGTADFIPVVRRESAPAGLSEASDNLINVTVENETLENVVSMFARISGANIVTTSADLQGTVTVNLRGVQWKPALSSILDVHDLALKEKIPGSEVYSIVPKPSASAEPLIVRSVFLNFTTVPEIMPIAQTMIGSVSNANISPFASRNAMVIKTTEANMAEVESLIEAMDVPGKQVVVETMFMELTDAASRKLGIRWDSLEEWGMGLDIGPLTYGRNIERGANRTDSYTFTDDTLISRENVDSRESSLNEARLFDMNGDQMEDFDLTLFDPNPNVDGDEIILQKTVATTTRGRNDLRSRSASDSRTINENVGKEVIDTFAKTISESQTALLDFETFNFVLSALKRTDGVSIVSNPKLIVASGSEDAFFTVGDREPIIRTEIQRGTQDSPGDIVIAELDTDVNTEYIVDGYLETGINLKVIPVVKTEDLIEATIAPSLIRRVLPDKIVGGNSWPRIAVKELKTTFTLRSGQTVAIGGLTDTSDDEKTSKIPLLGDIPLLGKYFFSHSSKVQQQVETIIFVTLSLADPEGLYREAGIPGKAELVHGKLIEDQRRRQKFEADLEDAQEAADAEAAQFMKDRLLKQRK